MTLHVDGVSVRFGATRVLDDVSLAVDTAQRVAVMGPSGTGKSTLLRAIAGLVRPDAGSIRLDGADITNTPPHLRPIGLMFQDYALFPHMSVEQNVAYGLRVQGTDAHAAHRRAVDLLEIVGLAEHADRNTSSLSGGEQQRVALARTLAPAPAVVLLDEPMGSVDNALKASLMDSTVNAIEAVGAAAIYVTHDRQEAERFADTIGIMHEGRIVRLDSAEGIWNDPQTEFVARFIGHENILDPGGPVLASALGTDSGATRGVVPMHALTIVEGTEGGSTVSGIVRSAVFTDGVYRMTVSTSDEEEIVLESRTRRDPGDPVTVAIDPRAVRSVVRDEV